MREPREMTLFASGVEDESHQNGTNLYSSLSLKHINYSCGSCGYELNLNSGNRNTSVIGSKYEKVIKKGVLSFWSIDETRFTRVEQRRWFRRRTKLLCHKCGNHIGNAQKASFHNVSWNGISDCDNIYEIKIRALQPSASYDSSIIF